MCDQEENELRVSIESMSFHGYLDTKEKFICLGELLQNASKPIQLKYMIEKKEFPSLLCIDVMDEMASIVYLMGEKLKPKTTQDWYIDIGDDLGIFIHMYTPKTHHALPAAHEFGMVGETRVMFPVDNKWTHESWLPKEKTEIPSVFYKSHLDSSWSECIPVDALMWKIEKVSSYDGDQYETESDTENEDADDARQ
jgi:hypothetical protein